jgi:hypothetical protein
MDQDKKLSTDLTPKEIDTVSFFSKDEVFISAFKKTEKLASATYMVTSLLSENEPMKWSLRKKVGDLLSFILAYKDTPKSVNNDFVYNAKTKVLELVSLLEVSMLGGLVSKMNYSILKQEYLNLIGILSPNINSEEESFSPTLSKTFFNEQPSELSPSHLKQIGTLGTFSPANTERTIPKISQRHIKDTRIGSINEAPKSNRQEVILNLIKRKGEITIKDASILIKDCSEKTIQRELIALIEKGIIQKKGERRWSKYSFIPNV